MKTLLESLYKNKIPKNEGYTFICLEDIYIPIFQVYLSITKRTSVPLNLIEEKVLELLDVGVHEISEMSDILGIDQNLLEITIADLYIKDMVYVSTSNCKLLANGRNALKTLGRIERKSDMLKDVYVDSITGDILSNVDQLNLIGKVSEDDQKLKVVQNVNNIEFFRKKFKDIDNIFYNEITAYQENSKEQVDELVSIDNIDNTFVKFLKLPIYLYVSKSGYDIDILCKSKKFQPILDIHKSFILDQIRNRKLMKKLFTNYSVGEKYDKKDLEPSENVDKIISNYYLKKDKSDEDLVSLSEIIFSDRKLAEGEIDDIIQHLISRSTSINIFVDKLDDWAWNSKFVTMLSTIPPNISYALHYNNFHNKSKALSQIKYSVKTFKDNHSQTENTSYIKYVFDNKYEILGVPHTIDAIERNVKVKAIDYYLTVL